MAVSEIRKLMKRLGLRPNKRLGQHYLIDEAVANRQVQYAKIDRSDTVLEIGPGLGILTRILSERAKKVIAIEKDPATVAYLRNEVEDVVIVEGDVLKVDLPEFDKIVSNLPFNISSPITFKLLEEKFQEGVLMYQKEFAQRLAAAKGSSDYSRLTVNTYYRAKCEVLETVPRSAFHPEPKVDSSVVRVIPRPPPFRVTDEDHFIRLVKALFNHRRKKISNSLMLEWRHLSDSQKTMKRIVSSLDYSDKRVEQLSPEEIGELSNWILKENFNLGKGHHS